MLSGETVTDYRGISLFSFHFSFLFPFLSFLCFISLISYLSLIPYSDFANGEYVGNGHNTWYTSQVINDANLR